MHNVFVPEIIAWAIAAIFAVSALVHLMGPGSIKRAYEHGHFPPKFYRMAGLIELITAAFLSNPFTRIWGVTLAALTIFVAVATLLNNRQYVYTVPGILLLIALVPAALAGPL